MVAPVSASAFTSTAPSGPSMLKLTSFEGVRLFKDSTVMQETRLDLHAHVPAKCPICLQSLQDAFFATQLSLQPIFVPSLG